MSNQRIIQDPVYLIAGAGFIVCCGIEGGFGGLILSAVVILGFGMLA